MAQKVIDVVGTIEKRAARRLRRTQWQTLQDGSRHEMGARGGTRNGTGRQEDQKIVKYRASTKTYSDIEKYGVDCGQLGAE